MKIRLHGTEDECREMAELLETIMLIQQVSDPYPDRGAASWSRLRRGHPARQTVNAGHSLPTQANTPYRRPGRGRLVPPAATAARWKHPLITARGSCMEPVPDPADVAACNEARRQLAAEAKAEARAEPEPTP